MVYKEDVAGTAVTGGESAKQILFYTKNPYDMQGMIHMKRRVTVI